jgi:hypothetical protein
MSEAEDSARTARHALPAREALAFVYRAPGPGVGAHVNSQRAVIRADAALDTPDAIRDNDPFFKRLTA